MSWLFARWIGGTLPTEAEWEFACRAGSDDKWCFGDDESKLSDHAWYGKNSDGQVHPVAKREANTFGLYDMHGNVWEWCAAWGGSYPADSADPSADSTDDPTGPYTGAGRVLRGGACWDGADHARSAYRFGFPPGFRNVFVGFRVVFRSRPAAPPTMAAANSAISKFTGSIRPVSPSSR